MIGSIPIVVRNNRVQYKFTIRRNFTILRGDSATGKSTLVDMVAAYYNDGGDSGVSLSSRVPCRVLAGRDWQATLATISSSVVFIDEGNGFVRSDDFARAAMAADNYFVIATREYLPNLPYSVDEIYGIKNETRARQKYRNIERVYSSFYNLYTKSELNENYLQDRPMAAIRGAMPGIELDTHSADDPLQR